MEGGRYSGGGVDLLSETYTQLHTIDGLADPQTYKFKSDLSISLSKLNYQMFTHLESKSAHAESF